MPHRTIEELIAQLEEKQRTVLAAGGPDRVQKQHEAGKLTARERLETAVRPGLLRRAGYVRRAPLHELRHGQDDGAG